MSESLLDALDQISDNGDGEQEESDGDAQDVNDALGDNKSYWKSRNQTKKVQKAVQNSETRDSEDEDSPHDKSDDEDAMNREE